MYKKANNITSKVVDGVIVVLALGAFIFEQSPANEALRALLGLTVLRATADPLAVGGAITAITMLIEFGSSSLFAIGVQREGSRLEKMLKRFHRRKSSTAKSLNDKTIKKSTTASKFADSLLAIGVGAVIVVAKKRLQDNKRSFREDLTTGFKASIVISLFSGGIGYLTAGGIRHAKEIGLEKPAQYIVDYGTDWRFWAAILLVVYGGGWVKNKFQQWRMGRQNPQ